MPPKPPKPHQIRKECYSPKTACLGFEPFCPCQRKVRKTLILQGFRAFFIPKINFAKIAIYRKISYIFEYYMSPDMSPAKDREPCCNKGF